MNESLNFIIESHMAKRLSFVWAFILFKELEPLEILLVYIHTIPAYRI